MTTLDPPVVSAITAGVLIIGQMALMIAVIRVRRGSGPSLGDGGDEHLLAAVRRHGNFAENAALFVVSLALVEILGAARPLVAVLAAVFIAGRILHAVGLSLTNTANVWRVAGIAATLSVAVVLGLRLVTLGIAGLR